MVDSFGEEEVRNAFGVVSSIRVSMKISGIIVAAGATAIDARIAEIQNAYRQDGRDAVLLLPSGAESHLKMSNRGSLYGTQIRGPNWQMQRGQGHLATGMPYTVEIFAEYPTDAFRSGLRSSSETLAQVGDGGPIVALTVLDNARPVLDQVSPASPVFITQSGERSVIAPSTSVIAYPAFNEPLFPNNVIRPSGFNRSENAQDQGNGKSVYAVSWSYTMQFTSPPFLRHPRT